MNNMFATLCLIGSMLGLPATAFALPDNEFACKVHTRSEQAGLVLVQAEDLSSARDVAARAEATRLDGVREKVKVVLECVSFPQGRLSDSEVQAFVDAMPR